MTTSSTKPVPIQPLEFEEYWTSINLPGPSHPNFDRYAPVYDAAKRAFEAGWDARAKFFSPSPTDLTAATGSAVVTYVTTAGSPDRLPGDFKAG